MGRFVDRTEEKHFRITFLEKTERRGNGGSVIWLCRCDCGKEFCARADQIISCHTKSCGCLSFENKSATCKTRNTTHGLAWKHKLYGVWVGMRRRCYDQKNCKSFKDYGARGIRVCDEWLRDYESFYRWGIDNGYAQGLEIDRIDNDGNYRPDNCRFVTRQENNKNKRKQYQKRS